MATDSPKPNTEQKDIWSATTYSQKVAPFVAKLTTKVVAWLEPQSTDNILDLGCGDGELTAKLAPLVSSITGIDSSPNMIEAFKRDYPSIPSRVVDARQLHTIPDLQKGEFTKVFSNAALHWILRDASTRSTVIRSVYDALKPGGTFVAEMGGFGNIAEIHAALTLELMHRGVPADKAKEACPWYFPSVETMKALLEEGGFVWEKGEAEWRQTLLTEGKEGGVKGWIKLFGDPYRNVLKTDEEWQCAVDNIVQALEGAGRRSHDGGFCVNYVRLRFIARKPE